MTSHIDPDPGADVPTPSSRLLQACSRPADRSAHEVEDQLVHFGLPCNAEEPYDRRLGATSP